jgi:hypothetical protein
MWMIMKIVGMPARSLLVAALLTGFASNLFAQTSTVSVPAVYSTTPMTRNADVTLAASILSSAAVDNGLAAWSSVFRAPRPSGRLARAAKVALFDIPVTTYFTGLNHEWGHQTSAHEFGVRSHLSLGSPWSSRQFRLESRSPMPEGELVTAVIHGGGLEASRRFKDRAEARMRRTPRIAPGHALATIIASMDMPIYVWHDLSPGRFSEVPSGKGDINTLLFDLAARRFGYDVFAAHEGGQGLDELENLRHRVRARATLNLLDAALWSEVAGFTVDHIWKGEESVRVRWLSIGGVGVLPWVRYEWSPYGPEYYAGSHVRTSRMTANAYVRRTETLRGERQTGGGASLSLPSLSTTFGGRDHDLVPTFELDLWSRTSEGSGGHASIGAELGDWPSRRAAITIAVGAKSRGHLIGYALDAGPYATIGLVVRVW